MGRLKGQFVTENNGSTGVQVITVAMQAQRMGKSPQAQEEQNKKVAKAANAGHFGAPVV
jgi:hypothetical protein